MTEFNNIVAWVPHTSLFLPNIDNSSKWDKVRRDALILADYKVDVLYNFLPNKITSQYSRFAVDLERYLDDKQEPMSAKGMGYLYNRLIDGTPFDRSVFGDASIFTEYYKQKHAELKKAVESIGNGCVLLDLHSFNPKPIECDMDKTPNRPDICLGFNEDETKPAENTLKAIKDYLEDNGLKVAYNTPFSGSMTTNTKVKYKSLMIEINKRCYLTNNNLHADIYKLSYKLRKICNILGNGGWVLKNPV